MVDEVVSKADEEQVIIECVRSRESGRDQEKQEGKWSVGARDRLRRSMRGHENILGWRVGCNVARRSFLSM